MIKNLWLVEVYCGGKWIGTNAIYFTRKEARNFCKLVLGKDTKSRYKRYIPAE